jgi:hypothetical protein
MLRQFTVIGFSANSEVFCPHCLRSTQGLTPDVPDYDGRPILPLYAGDKDLHEECCTYCEKNLLALAEYHAEKATPARVQATLRFLTRDAWALEFDRIPPANVRTELKQTSWRWSPRAQHWWTKSRTPTIPARIQLLEQLPERRVSAKPPIIRRAASRGGARA